MTRAFYLRVFRHAIHDMYTSMAGNGLNDKSNLFNKVALNRLVTGKPVALRWNQYLEMLVSQKKGKPEYPEKNLLEQGENQQQTQPTYGVGSAESNPGYIGGNKHSHCYDTLLQF